MSVKLVWVTPEAEKQIMYCARVSNPSNQNSENTKLLEYCAKHGHWSVFEMGSMCVEIETSRTIARQILRHRSFAFQEFSQRYEDVTTMGKSLILSQARSQDLKNRQNSNDNMDQEDKDWFEYEQQHRWSQCLASYKAALERGIAKEQARVFLPEGLTPSRMYMTGTIRSWIHYCQLRCGNGTQKEHIEIAKLCKKILVEQIPSLDKVLNVN